MLSAANRDGSLVDTAGTAAGIKGTIGVELVVALVGAAGIAVSGMGGIVAAGWSGSVGVAVGPAVISGMWASAELVGVTPMAAVVAVAGIVGGGSAVCVHWVTRCYGVMP